MKHFAFNLPLLKHYCVTKEYGDDKPLKITFQYCNAYVRCVGKVDNNSTLPLYMQVWPLLHFTLKRLI